MKSLTSKYLDLDEFKKLVIVFITFFVLSLAAVWIGDLKFGLKLALLAFFIFATLNAADRPKWVFLLYLPSIPLSSALILFTPFFKRFSGFFVEVPNVYAIYNSLARPDGIYIYTILEAILLFFLTYQIATKQSLRYKSVLLFILFFVISSFFSIFSTLNVTRTFFQNIHLLFSLVMFYFSLQLWDDQKYENLVIFVLLILILLTVVDVISLKAIKMLLAGKWIIREVGRFNTPNPPAHLAGMGVIFSLYLAFKRRFPSNILYFGFAGILLVVILCTGSRNGLISTIIASFLFLFFATKSREKYNWILVTITGFVFLVVFYKLGRLVFQLRLNPQLLLYDTSILSRFLLWKNSLRYFIAHPFSPVGTGNFFYFYGSLGLPFAHNFLINLLIESGLVPFLMALWAYFLGIKKIVGKIVEFFKLSEVRKEELVAVAFILYMMMLFSADQFLYDGSLWRFMLVFLSFSISKLWREKGEEIAL